MSMPTSLATVLEKVARRVTPSLAEKQRMSLLAQRLRNQVREILESAGIEGTVSIQGSFARDTWLRGDHDLDIFASFPPSMDRLEWTERVLPIIRKGIGAKTIDRYAEHPYLELRSEDTRVNIVPCYSVEKGQWKSATDRTPYHTEYMQKHLTSETRREARILKRFMKGIRSYGAEIRVGGFSGMLVETLILHYGTFLRTLEQVSRWRPIVFLDLEEQVARDDSAVRKFDSQFVVIDPVDPERNLAAAVRQDKLWSFVAACREIQQNPGLWYFFPPKPEIARRSGRPRLIERKNRDLVVFFFQHSRIVPDVLWGQLLSLGTAAVELLTRQEFHPIRFNVWSDEIRYSAILVEMDSAILPRVQLRHGPPVSREIESQSFLTRHRGARDTIRGPWILDGRWVVEKERSFRTVELLFSAAFRDPKIGLSIPDQLATSLRRTIRILINREILRLVGREGFEEVLSDFLTATPGWLKHHH